MLGFAPLAASPLAGLTTLNHLQSIAVASTTATAALDVQHHLAGTPAAIAASASASITIEHQLAGSLTTVPNSYGSIDIEHHLSETAAASPAASASLDVQHHLAGSIAGQPALSASLDQQSYIATTPGISAPIPLYRCRVRSNETFTLTLPTQGVVEIAFIKMQVGQKGQPPVLSFMTSDGSLSFDFDHQLMTMSAPVDQMADLAGMYDFDVVVNQLGYLTTKAVGSLHIVPGVTTI